MNVKSTKVFIIMCVLGVGLGASLIVVFRGAFAYASLAFSTHVSSSNVITFE